MSSSRASIRRRCRRASRSPSVSSRSTRSCGSWRRSSSDTGCGTREDAGVAGDDVPLLHVQSSSGRSKRRGSRRSRRSSSPRWRFLEAGRRRAPRRSRRRRPAPAAPAVPAEVAPVAAPAGRAPPASAEAAVPAAGAGRGQVQRAEKEKKGEGERLLSPLGRQARGEGAAATTGRHGTSPRCTDSPVRCRC